MIFYSMDVYTNSPHGDDLSLARHGIQRAAASRELADLQDDLLALGDNSLR